VDPSFGCPGGRSIVYVQSDQSDSDVMLMEDFR
jgi:hypothetical protein